MQPPLDSRRKDPAAVAVADDGGLGPDEREAEADATAEALAATMQQQQQRQRRPPRKLHVVEHKNHPVLSDENRAASSKPC